MICVIDESDESDTTDKTDATDTTDTIIAITLDRNITPTRAPWA